MLGSVTLEVGIGIVLSYLLICLVLTSATEAIETWTKSRADGLEVAIGELVDDPPAQPPAKPVQGATIEGLRIRIYNHPLIRALYRGDYYSDRVSAGGNMLPAMSTHRPSYIPRETFAMALADLMEPASVSRHLASPVFEAAWTLLEKITGRDADKMRTEVALWYDAAMDRASSRYKRKTQKRLFWAGLLLAIAFNVNSVLIAKVLIHNDPKSVETRLAEYQAAKELVAHEPSQSPSPEALTASGPANKVQGTDKVKDAKGGASGRAGVPVPGIMTTQTAEEAKKAGAAPAAAKTDADDVTKWGKLTKVLEASNLPIGWEGDAADIALELLGSSRPALAAQKWHFMFSWSATFGWLLLIAGYLMTAVAATFGSPFWFDLLGRIVNVRAAVKPPEPKK